MATARNKDHPENSAQGQADKAAAEQADTAAQQVKERMAAETDQGFRGVEVDPTPNENYSVAGVTSGAPTPETDEDAAEEARRARLGVEKRNP